MRTIRRAAVPLSATVLTNASAGLAANSLRRGRTLGAFLASLLVVVFLAAAVSATPASAATGTWRGTLGIDWDAQLELGHERFDGQVTITGSEADPEVSSYWPLYGPFSATWSHDFHGSDFGYPPCTATGGVMSPEFVPGASDQSLSMGKVEPPDTPEHDDPYKGTYTLTSGPEVMIAASGCEHYAQAYNGQGYQWRLSDSPSDDNLPLTLPTEGERAPQIEAGGKLHWTGQQSSTYSPDSETAETVTAVWTYDLTYDPAASRCKLTAKTPQKLSKALTVKVIAGDAPCAAKIKSVKYKVGNKVYNVKKKPRRTVGAGTSWNAEFPISGKLKEIFNKALNKGNKVSGTVTADLDGKTRSVTVKIN